MKKRNLLCTLLAAIMILLMAVTTVNIYADEPASDEDTVVEGEGMTLKKTASVQDDGTYIIDLEAFATGEVTITDKVVPADIVLLLDVSGSMNDSIPGSSAYIPGTTYTVQQVYSARSNYNYYFKIDGEYKGRADNIAIDRKAVGTENQYTIQVDHVRTQNTGTTHTDTNVLNYQNASASVTVYKTADNTQPVPMTVQELVDSYETITYYYPHRGRHGNSTTQTTVYEKINHVNLVNTVTLYTYRIAGVTDEMEGADDEGYVPEGTNVQTYTSSNTKLSALKNAVEGFINTVAENNSKVTEASDKSAIAIVKFAYNRRNSDYSQYQSYIGDDKDSSNYNYTQVVKDMTTIDATTQAEFNDAVYAFTSGGATAADYGMGYTEAIFAKHPIAEGSNRKQIVVMFTDGEPNHYSGFDGTVANSAISAAKDMKDDGVTVYTIAVYDGASTAEPPTTNINKYLHAVSSNYPNATSYNDLGTRGEGNHYFTATTADELASIFDAIAQESASTTAEVNAESVLKDIVSGSFTLPDGADEDDITVKIVRWDSSKHAWGEGNGFVFTPEQWKTASTTYGATEQENVTVGIDGKDVNVTGFDYALHYKATNSEQDTDELDQVDGVNKNTAKVVVSFEIDAKPSAITGASVATNGENSGIYLHSDDEEPLIKFRQPNVVFNPVTYVVDYVTSDTSKDTKASSIKLDYSGILKNVQMLDDPSDDVLKGEKVVDFDYTIYKGRFGTISFGDDENDVQRRYVRYAPTTMDWNDYDRIFIKGESNTTDNKDVWAMMAVLPANSVFYEDTYITQTKTVTYNGQDVTIEYTGIKYDEGKWNTVGTEGKNQTYHAGDDMGWISGLADDSTYANDMAHTANQAKAKATFTFSGTGVDIYSRTNGSTGTCTIKVVSAAEENESGKKISKAQIIDTKAAAGDFFAIPVCTFTDLPYGKYTATITVTAAGQKEGRMTFYLDGVRVYNPIKPLEDDENVIQIYGEKNLGAVFTEVRSMLGTDADAEALYLDEFTTSTTVTDVAAIETAAQALAEAQQARDAYVEAKITPAKNAISEAEYALESAKAAVTNAQAIYEANPTPENQAKLESAQQALDEAQATYDSQIEGLEDALEAANAGKTQYDDAVNAAIAAYDEANDGVDVAYSEATIAQYEKEGPNSEVYLDYNQQVAINVESGKYYYIGLKSLKGDDVTAEINGKQVKLNHTTDLYYEATPASGNIITIKNVSAGILSITKLRTTGVGNKTKGTRLASSEETLAYVRSFEAELVANSDSDYTGEILTEEEAGLERIGTTEAEMTVESLEESDITIENPETDVTYDELKNALNKKSSSLSKLMSSFSRFLGH